MIPSFFLHLLLLPFSPRTLSSMKSSALLYTILWSISGCDVREAFLLQLKTGSFLLFPKIETSMEMNVPLCEYEDDGWDDASNNLVKLLLQENSLLQGGRFGTHQMKGIEDMTIDTLMQTLPTIELSKHSTSKTINFGGKLSFILSFLFPECPPTGATYIFTVPTCTTTINQSRPLCIKC
jgi:hypothetical protein